MFGREVAVLQDQRTVEAKCRIVSVAVHVAYPADGSSVSRMFISGRGCIMEQSGHSRTLLLGDQQMRVTRYLPPRLRFE